MSLTAIGLALFLVGIVVWLLVSAWIGGILVVIGVILLLVGLFAGASNRRSTGL